MHVYLWQTRRQDLIIWSLKDKLVKCLIENQILPLIPIIGAAINVDFDKSDKVPLLD